MVMKLPNVQGNTKLVFLSQFGIHGGMNRGVKGGRSRGRRVERVNEREEQEERVILLSH
jgi:hypothetical protein